MKVIDVSKHNGTINWSDVKKDGIEGVIIRAGHGKLASQKDPMFETNYKGALTAGLHIGAYWYSYAVTAAEAKNEAEVFLEAIKGKKFDLPVYLDIEDKTQVPLGKKVCTDIVNTFMGVLEAAGYFAGVYSFDSFFGSNLEAAVRSRYALWVARVENVAPAYAPEWGMHQYSWKGKVSGINGDVDMDNCIKDYPTVIKNSGLNGYSKSDTYKVTAEIGGVTSAKASTIAAACQQMGMTVAKEKN
ncbi:MAG: glycoside hydrolase family 25 protein [Oscillospiraceae bacterium]|nr:glycoside hydrolase family 25 protein [Oscillospiraceae bacterium]